MLTCSLNIQEYHLLVPVLSRLSSGPMANRTGPPTPGSGGSDRNSRHGPLCLLLHTWPHMCSALLFARSYQRSLRFVSCPKPSQTRNGGTLTKKELLSRGRSVEKVRQIGTTEETFQTFHSPLSSNSYLASPKALKMFSEQLYSIHLG